MASNKQWRSTVSAPLCAFCNKSVYPAEEVIAAGQKFHKLCLKCGNIFFFIIQILSHFPSLASCNTLLNSGNLNERDKSIYCVTCYRREFGPRGRMDLFSLKTKN
jgi:hypothetical protein